MLVWAGVDFDLEAWSAVATTYWQVGDSYFKPDWTKLMEIIELLKHILKSMFYFNYHKIILFSG